MANGVDMPSVIFSISTSSKTGLEFEWRSSGRQHV